jgi:UDP-glucuronate 4-epimerase
VRYVVTGAAGFIGSHLAETLAARGDDVLGVDCFSGYYDADWKRANAAGVPVVSADLADAPLDELFAGADGVFHLAAQPGVRPSWADLDTYLRNNVLAAQRVFAAAAGGGARVVFSSSSSVYGEAERYPTAEDVRPRPLSPYGITKLAAEELARAYARAAGLDVVTLRYFTVYGPRQRPDMAFTRMLSALATGGQFPLFGDGRTSRSFTYVGDVVAATVAAMERAPAGATYNVGGGAEASLIDAIALCERIAGRRLRLEHAPGGPGDPRRTCADTTRIRADLGWEAAVPLADGLAEQWRWVAARLDGQGAAADARQARPAMTSLEGAVRLTG